MSHRNVRWMAIGRIARRNSPPQFFHLCSVRPFTFVQCASSRLAGFVPRAGAWLREGAGRNGMVPH
jgi:hypothetical protein